MTSSSQCTAPNWKLLAWPPESWTSWWSPYETSRSMTMSTLALKPSSSLIQVSFLPDCQERRGGLSKPRKSPWQQQYLPPCLCCNEWSLAVQQGHVKVTYSGTSHYLASITRAELMCKALHALEGFCCSCHLASGKPISLTCRRWLLRTYMPILNYAWERERVKWTAAMIIHQSSESSIKNHREPDSSEHPEILGMSVNSSCQQPVPTEGRAAPHRVENGATQRQTKACFEPFL